MKQILRSAQDDKPPTLGQVIASVLASFFGVQSSKNRARDFKHGKAAHFIVVGLLATAAFVGLVVALVRLALRQAGL
jgi:hypothetical protein